MHVEVEVHKDESGGRWLDCLLYVQRLSGLMDFVRSASRSFHGSSGTGRRTPLIGSSQRVSNCHRSWSIPCPLRSRLGTLRTTLDDVSRRDRRGVKTRVIRRRWVAGRGERQGGRDGAGPSRRRRSPPIFTLRRRVAFIRQLRCQLPLRSAVNEPFTM